jgi:CRP-like cAMP-binding protein
VDKLRKLPVFREVPDDVFNVFVPMFKEEGFKAHETIFEEGSVSDRLFVIKEGEVEIRKATGREEAGQKLIAVFQSGEFFGEMSVFLDQPRTAAAVAKTDVKLISLSRKALSDMLSKSPDAAFKVMGFFTSVLTERLVNTTKELVTVYETGRLITTAHNVMQLSEYVLDGAINAVEQADAGLFVIWNEFNEEFEVIGQTGYEDLKPGAAFPEDDGLVIWLDINRDTLVSFDLPHDRRVMLKDDSLWRCSSLLASPFILKDNLLGFVVLLNRKMRSAFTYNHMVLLSAISGYVSVALENLQFIQAELDRTRLDQTKATIQPY